MVLYEGCLHLHVGFGVLVFSGSPVAQLVGRVLVFAFTLDLYFGWLAFGISGWLEFGFTVWVIVFGLVL